MDRGFLKNILVDADGLVALAKIDDSNHKKAVQVDIRLKKIGVVYYFSPFAVPEAVTVLSYKVSHLKAKEFLKSARKLDIITFKLPEKYEHLADNWFNKQRKKGTSYFDCYNMALLDRYRNQLDGIFSFDEVYRRNGFTLATDFSTN